MTRESKAKLQELCKDEEYLKGLLGLGSADAIAEELKKRDVEISAEELREVGRKIIELKSSELTDEELEKVTGGEAFALGLIISVGLAAVAAAAALIFAPDDEDK